MLTGLAALSINLPFSLSQRISTAPENIRVPDGFKVELVYEVPAEAQGSWVALCLDPQGRFIAGDQKGGLYRLTLENGSVSEVESIDVEVGYVNGLTYAFGSLYAVVAEDVFQGGGLYRIQDVDGDDKYDSVEYLRDFVAKGEHGPHSVIPGPKGDWLYVVSGNKTPLPEGPNFRSLVPEHWGEDDLLPRMWGPIGSEKGTTAPGGWIARTDPEGEQWELIAIGLRNAFDIAFDLNGVLFTTDADAEFDMATPWYQPTRLLQVVNGSDYGWRSGSGKWAPYYEDTLPPVYEYGPGSPTGIAFGYGAAFPDRYQKALFACDWSWGRVFATWMEPDGASFKAHTEEFLTGVPLPVADLIVNPKDGAMYFTLGGRDTTSGLYRISYVGSENAVVDSNPVYQLTDEAKALEKLSEALASTDARNVDTVWPYLSSDTRELRHAARLRLESSPVETWAERAFSESNPVARMTALLGLSRAGSQEQLEPLLQALLALKLESFSNQHRLLWIRCLEMALHRMDGEGQGRSIAQLKNRARSDLESLFPSSDGRFNTEALKALVYLESSKATEPAVALLQKALSQEDKLHYILTLRLQTNGWTPELRSSYFMELGKARAWPGGRSLTKYVEMIVADSLGNLSESNRARYQSLMDAAEPEKESFVSSARSFVEAWTADGLLGMVDSASLKPDLQNGRQAFADVGCFACHRVKGEGGGAGPDLTAAMRRFSPGDFLEAVIEPSKTISDQFGLSSIEKRDGSIIVGKIVNYYGESVGIQADPLNAAEVTRVPRSEIASIKPSPVSPMPPGLFNVLTAKDVADLIAFLEVSGRASESDVADR